MKENTIVCIGAHPDDVELSMGGTVFRMCARGHKVILIDITNGEPTPMGSPSIRKAESEQARLLLNVERIQLGLENRFLEDTIKNRKRLAEVLRKYKCDYIFTHYEFDSHPDHSTVSKMTDAARFYCKLTKSDIKGDPFYPEKIIYYFPNHIHLDLSPTFCVDISEELDKKRKVLESYQSQFLKKGNGEVIENCLQVNRYYGIRIQKKAAEPFYLRDSLDIVQFSNLF